MYLSLPVPRILWMDILIVGPAGSGKSLLTASFGRYLEGEYSVRYVNLDPGIADPPYKPDFDVRHLFTLEDIMRESGLGPNGAMLEAIDRMADLEFEVDAADWVLIDSPGQMEPFVFRETGPRLVERLGDPCCVYVVDATSPLGTLPSLYLYSLAAQYALGAPAINVFNKIDLMPGSRRAELAEWIRNPRLEGSLQGGVRDEINAEVLGILKRYLPSQEPCLVSARTGEGFDHLFSLVHEVRCACGDLT